MSNKIERDARTSARQLVEFIDGYVAALLWSSTDTTDGGEIVNLDEYELSTAAADKCRADCFAFFSTNRADIDEAAGSCDLYLGDDMEVHAL